MRKISNGTIVRLMVGLAVILALNSALGVWNIEQLNIQGLSFRSAVPLGVHLLSAILALAAVSLSLALARRSANADMQGDELLQREKSRRQKAELRLRSLAAKEQSFQTLFEASPGAFLLLAPEDYKIVAASDAYLDATMTVRTDILGRQIFDVFPDDPDELGATGVRILREALDRVKETGRGDAMALLRYPVRQASGKFEVRWWSAVNSPVFGQSGELSYIVHRVQDVTSHVELRGGNESPSGNLDGACLELEIVHRAQDLRQANRALRDNEALLETADREYRELAAVISHDLKDSLTLARRLESDHAVKLDDFARETLAAIILNMSGLDQKIARMVENARQLR